MPRFAQFTRRLPSLLVIVALAGAVQAEDQKGKAMSYGEVKEFLSKHTQVVELTNDAGARVLLAPEWQGRVMTSTCDGPGGASFGFINYDYIKAGKVDLHFNNYGGEDRLWLCPEGGQFSLWFKPGDKQEMKNWFTAPALNEGSWAVPPPGRRGAIRGRTAARAGAAAGTVHMAARLQFQNASATAFDLDMARNVRLLATSDVQKLLGDGAAKLMAAPGVKTVAYETDNKITNRGPAFVKDKGLVSIWILSMMNAAPKTIVLAPYKPGSEADLGPVVKSDYFGTVPADRLKIIPEAVLFRADYHYRSKIGVSQRRVRNVLGSMDFDANVLTIAQFTMPDNPADHIYLNNMWELPQKDPFHGDVANSYNDGPNDLGSQLGAMYEIESISPAPVLNTGESIEHCHRTIHVQADYPTLQKLAKEVLGVELDDVKKVMF
jgi:hypothetical protein